MRRSFTSVSVVIALTSSSDADRWVKALGKWRTGDFSLSAVYDQRTKHVPTAPYNSEFGDDRNQTLNQAPSGDARDVRLRVATRHTDVAPIDRLLREVTALWTCGPAGGGGVRTAKRQRLSNQACLVPRQQVPATFEFA